MKDIILKLENINAILNSSNGPVYLLNDISLELIRGQMIGLIGESGSGKTQLCLASSGMQDLTPGVISGEVIFNDSNAEVSIYPTEETYKNNIFIDINNNYKRTNEFAYNKTVKRRTQNLKNNVIGWIPQDSRNFLNPFWKINRLFKESFNLLNNTAMSTQFSDLDSFIRHYLFQVDLEYNEIKDKYPHEMSGGECQRAMIAFVLSKNPDFIIADETTTGLDVSRQKRIIDLFKSIKKNNPSLTIIFVSHDFGFLDHVVDQYLVMYGGFLIEHIKNKNRIKESIHELHPYTQDLLSRLFDNDKNESYDELASKVNLHTKLDACPYRFSCRYIGNEEPFEDKCNSELPPIINNNQNNLNHVELTDDWQRCWRKIDEIK